MNFRRLKYSALPYNTDGVTWLICPYTGSLLKSKSIGYEKILMPVKVSSALRLVDNPYDIKPLESSGRLTCVDASPKLAEMFNTLNKSVLSGFYSKLLYSGVKKTLFDNTVQAVQTINSLPQFVKDQHKLCLPRVLLASKTSKSFTSNGVIFIGAFIPTGDMHTWIIESGVQPDFDDQGWVNYRPLLALYN